MRTHMTVRRRHSSNSTTSRSEVVSKQWLGAFRRHSYMSGANMTVILKRSSIGHWLARVALPCCWEILQPARRARPGNRFSAYLNRGGCGTRHLRMSCWRSSPQLARVRCCGSMSCIDTCIPTTYGVTKRSPRGSSRHSRILTGLRFWCWARCGTSIAFGSLRQRLQTILGHRCANLLLDTSFRYQRPSPRSNYAYLPRRLNVILGSRKPKPTLRKATSPNTWRVAQLRSNAI